MWIIANATVLARRIFRLAKDQQMNMANGKKIVWSIFVRFINCFVVVSGSPCSSIEEVIQCRS